MIARIESAEHGRSTVWLSSEEDRGETYVSNDCLQVIGIVGERDHKRDRNAHVACELEDLKDSLAPSSRGHGESLLIDQTAVTPSLGSIKLRPGPFFVLSLSCGVTEACFPLGHGHRRSSLQSSAVLHAVHQAQILLISNKLN